MDVYGIPVAQGYDWEEIKLKLEDSLRRLPEIQKEIKTRERIIKQAYGLY